MNVCSTAYKRKKIISCSRKIDKNLHTQKVMMYYTKMFAKMYKYWHNVRKKLFAKGITTALSEDRGKGIMRESKEAHIYSGGGKGG